MTFIDLAVRDYPVSAFAMDDSSPFQDYSGNDKVATSQSTAVQHAALVSGTMYSQVFTNANKVSYDTSVIVKDRESYSFTLEAWVKVVDGTGAQQVLGNTNINDGLWIDGNVVSFTVKYATAPDATISYDTQMNKTIHLVGVKNSSKMMLFVNGVMVKELSLTEAQKADSYLTTPSTMSSGRTTGTQSIALNGVCFYAREITPEQIVRHYTEGIRGYTAAEVAVANGGTNIPTTLSDSDLFLDLWFTTGEDWNSGVLQNVFVMNDALRPQFESNMSVSGTWRTVVDLGQANATSIYGVTLDWYGEGAVVKTSLDGTTWVTATRGASLPNVTSGFNPTGQVLYVEVSFPGGIVDDTSYLDNLNVVGFKTGLPQPSGGRQLTLTKAYPKRNYPVKEYNENWGILLDDAGKVAIGPDTSGEALPIRTLEIWIKRTGATNNTYTSSGPTFYQNGVVNASVLVRGAWTLLHIVNLGNITTDLNIGYAAQIGVINVYSTALTATDVSNIYKQYMSSNTLQVLETNVLAVAEPAQSAVLYAHDWSIQSSG